MRLPKAFLALALFTLAAPAHTQEVPKLNLRVEGEIVLPHTFAPMAIGEILCDSRGNIYLQPYQLLKPLSAPVLRLSPDGERITPFALTSAPGFEESQVLDYKVGPRGEVYFLSMRLVDEIPEIDLVAFHDDGTFGTTTKLAPEFIPSKFALFTSGAIFVTGVKQTSKDQMVELAPYTAVLDPSGRLVKELNLPGDIPPETRDYSKPLTDAEKRTAPLVVAAAGLSEAIAGEDGNVYLMRHTAKSRIFVISGTGEIIHTFSITPPREGATAEGLRNGTGGTLIVYFAVPTEKREQGGDMVFSVINAETGQRELDYWASDAVRGWFACATPRGFTLLGQAKNSSLTIKQVTAH